MQKGRRLVIALAIIGVLFAFWRISRGPNEPHDGGRPLSYWVIRLWQYPGEDPAAPPAIRRIGTNALPWLMTWLESQPKQSPPRAATGFIVRNMPYKLVPGSLLDWAYDNPLLKRAENSSSALGVLGLNADPVVARLCQLTGDQTKPDVAARAAHALAMIGASEAVPTLAANLTNGHPNRSYFAWLIGNIPAFATNAAPAFPALLQCLHDPDPAVTGRAARSLALLRTNSEGTISALVDYLHRAPSADHERAALTALAICGSDAHAQAPSLQKSLTNANMLVRYVATNALMEIAPELLTNAPPPPP